VIKIYAQVDFFRRMLFLSSFIYFLMNYHIPIQIIKDRGRSKKITIKETVVKDLKINELN